MAGIDFTTDTDLQTGFFPFGGQGGEEGPGGAPGPRGYTGDAGPTGLTGDDGTPGSKSPRQNTVLATASLASLATDTGTVALSLSYRVLRVATDVPARVLLYTTVAKRGADTARPIIEDPVGDHGVTLEVVTSDASLSIDLAPTSHGSNMEAPPTNDIPYSVTNLGLSAQVVTVTFTWQETE